MHPIQGFSVCKTNNSINDPQEVKCFFLAWDPSEDTAAAETLHENCLWHNTEIKALSHSDYREQLILQKLL